MSGSIIFHPTAAGMDIQNQCLISGDPLPAIAAISCSDGVPHDNPYTATSLTGTQLHAVQTSATRKSASAIEFQAGFSPEGALTLTQLGVWLSDGTLFAYAVLPQPYFKGEGVGLSLPGVLSRQGLGDFQLDINILDVNALAEVIKNLALDRFAGAAAPIVTDYITPLERAVTYAWDVGIQRFQMEFFSERFSLRDTPPLAISGVIAGDDSIDLAGGNATLTAGDYVIFDGSRSEHVRIQSSLELGRRRLVNNILHTYPSAQLARTNWLIHSGEAECPAGSVYFAKRLRLIEGDVHRLYLRGLTAPGAPDVSWRTDHGEFIATPLARQTAIDSEWSDYAFDIPAGEYFHIRIVTPQATRLRAVVACNTLHDTRVVTPPVVVGDEAKPGVAMTLQLSASSRLSGGQIAQFDLVRDGVLSQHPATANQAAISLTFNGELGEQQRLIATAVDDLGNRSASVVHGVTLVDSLTPPVPAAPVLISPAAGATGVSVLPLLAIQPLVFAGETHASTDWQIRASNGVDVVWQALASAQLTSMTVSEALPANTELQVWVRGRGSLGTETAWGSRGFGTVATVVAGEVVYTAPGVYDWMSPITGPISLLLIGAGAPTNRLPGGGGGGSVYQNGVYVQAGHHYQVIVGSGFFDNDTLDGRSCFGHAAASENNDWLLCAYGGLSPSDDVHGGGGGGYWSMPGSDAVGHHGGDGGDSAGAYSGIIGGGGGAAGYTSHGGVGGSAYVPGLNSADGGGGGGGNLGNHNGGGGGGGVGLFGSSISGGNGGPAAHGGTGGSGGHFGDVTSGGQYGGGAGGALNGVASHGGSGAVRIIWGTDNTGNPRTFPNNAA